jgi:mono/diheme cytochrome c family protein
MLKKLLFTVIVSFIGLSFISFTKGHIQDIKKGKEVYTQYCQNCHMENGEGQPGIQPPLAKTAYLKDTKKIISVILEGQSGEIIVNGKKYNGIMPAQAYLTDVQIADVLTYIRRSWGNKYPVVTPAQVKKERK